MNYSVQSNAVWNEVKKQAYMQIHTWRI